MSNESTAEKLEKLFLQKIDSGFQITDKNQCKDLIKICMRELRLRQGWSSKAKECLEKAMAQRNISSPFAKKIEGLTIEIEKSAPIQPTPQTPQPTPQEPTQPTPQEPTQPTPQPTPQEPTQEQREPLQPLSEQEKKFYESVAKDGAALITQLYVMLGLVEGSQQTKDEPTTQEKFQKDAEVLMSQWADYATRNNIRLPRWIEIATLASSTFLTLGLPLFKTFLFGKKTTQDISLDQVGDSD